MAQVRLATADDLNDVYVLLVNMWNETDYVHFEFSPERTLSGIFDWINKESSVMFVVEKDKQIIGFIAGVIFQPWMSNDKCAMEQLFFVKKSERGTGVAGLLLDAFISWTKNKCKHVQVSVTTGKSEAAEVLYKKRGLSYVGGNYIKHWE